MKNILQTVFNVRGFEPVWHVLCFFFSSYAVFLLLRQYRGRGCFYKKKSSGLNGTHGRVFFLMRANHKSLNK
jgi:hypothetical protein